MPPINGAKCLSLICRDIARLARAMQFRGRTPRFTPATLRRLLPRLYRHAADTGERLTETDRQFLRMLAEDIETPDAATPAIHF